MEAHRDVEPPVYNSRRVNESPIPLTVHQIDSNRSFEETINSEDAENGELSMVSHENLSHSDLLVQSTVSDHIDTTNDNMTSDEIGNGAASNENSIENVNIENDREAAELSNVSVDDEAEITEIELNLENDCNVNHKECDPLAVSSELADDECVNDEIEPNSDRNVVPENVSGALDAHDATAQTEENLVINSNAKDKEIDPLAIGDLDDLNVCAAVKVEPLPIYDNHLANDDDIENLLDEPIEEICDDIVIVIGRSGIPKPLRMTNEQTIKRENDKMSGNLTFSVSVRFIL